MLAEAASDAKTGGFTNPGPVTQDLTSTLARYHFIWNDWENNCVVADSSNMDSHRGHPMGSDAIIKAIELGNLTVPSAFQPTVTSVKKMLQYVFARTKPGKKGVAV